ncbi:spermidine synthase [Bacillus sp. FJAT-27264]|uniref:spermidine synthase n=1 Tax=Paenibacillus sp. (strain DSM 101736 / FJAT-27264) TaxID=1850362 RepID=UPI000807F1C6|nr:fused MFS/spermidine synthase [Bacillus sp. FJAT-27264]OBZ14041.1 spermidine synthase [Bacillus sp. FJAT-27264]
MNLLHKEIDEGSGGNYEILVYDTAELYGEKGAFRVLEFSNEAIQGAMDLNRPDRVMFEYPRAIIHLMEHNAPEFEAAFLIGHGIGTIASYFADRRMKVAEHNKQVLEISRRWFGYDRDNVVVGDGRSVLGGEAPQTYDYIIVDAFTDKGTPSHLTSEGFFTLAAEKLDERGAVILNLMGRGEQDWMINAIHTTLSRTFAYTRAFALSSDNASDVLNIVMIGSYAPIGFVSRQMAGFTEISPGPGHVIWDSMPVT